MLIPAFDGEQPATQVCEPNQAHPSEWAFTPRHTPAREHDCQRVASRHYGSDTRWRCTERCCQHGAYRHVRNCDLNNASQSLRIFRDVSLVAGMSSAKGDRPHQDYHLTHVLLAASRKSFPNRSALAMDFILARRWSSLYASSYGPWYVYLLLCEATCHLIQCRRDLSRGLSRKSLNLYLAHIMASSTVALVCIFSLPSFCVLTIFVELKELIALHSSVGEYGGDLRSDTVTIIGATLDLQEKTTSQVRVFNLSTNQA